MTVKELIKILQELPQDTTVVINDADTNWPLNINEVNNRVGYIEISGSYDNQWTTK